MSEAPMGLLTTIRKRIIVISTMERDVRLAFASGSAAVVVAVAFNLFSPLGPPVATLVGEIPLGTLVALFLGEFVVATLVAAVLIETTGHWRNALYGAIGVLLILFLWSNNFTPSAFAVVMPLGSALFFSLRRQARDWDRRQSLFAAAFTAGLALIVMLAYIGAGEAVLVVSMIGLQGLVAMLGLFMAATDLAEIASVASDSILAKLTGASSRVSVALIAAALAIITNFAVSRLFSNWANRTIAQDLGSGLGIFLWLAAIYGLVRWAARRAGEITPEIRYSQLFMVVATYFVALQIGVAWRVMRAPESYDPRYLFTYPEVFTIPFILFILGIVALFMVGRRVPRSFSALTFAVWVGLLWFHYFASHGAAIFYVQDAVVIGTALWLGLAGWFKGSRAVYGTLARLIGDLNLSFALYAMLVFLFFKAKGGGAGLTFWQALIVLSALAWDILTSGEVITNRHTEAFPRFARVCLFMAYVISVALLVLVSTSSALVLPSSGREAEGVFESEGLVATGLVLFGPAFLFTIFSLRARNAFARPAAPNHAVPAAMGAPPQP